MMTHAYQEIYLSKAQSVLGDAFDYAVNICGIPGNRRYGQRAGICAGRWLCGRNSAESWDRLPVLLR